MKFNCVCGYEFHDTADMLPFKGHIITDIDLDGFDSMVERFACARENEKEARRQEYINMLVNKFRTVYQCPDCGTLYIDNNDGNGRLIPFVPFEAFEKEGTVSEKMKALASDKNYDPNKRLFE